MTTSATAPSGPIAPQRPGRTSRATSRDTSRRRQALAGWGFMAPFLLVFALVFIAPLAYALYLSLFREQLIGGTSFVGADNYVQALGDPAFWASFRRVALFLVIQVPIMLGLALLAALAIDSARLHGAAFFRIAIFLPYAVPAVVAALMWGFMYGPRFGLVGNLNEALGWHLPDPLSSDLVLASIGNIVTWEFVGYNMLIFYAALRVIPHELYEAAELDGAGQLRIVSAIKVPALRGAIVVATIFSVIGSFQLFNEPNILRSLAPNAISTSYTPNMYAYNLSFAGQQYNYSATVAIIMGLLTVVVAYAVQVRGMREGAAR